MHVFTSPEGTPGFHANKERNPDYSFIKYTPPEARAVLAKHFDAHILAAYDCLVPMAYKADLFRASKTI